MCAGGPRSSGWKRLELHGSAEGVTNSSGEGRGGHEPGGGEGRRMEGVCGPAQATATTFWSLGVLASVISVARALDQVGIRCAVSGEVELGAWAVQLQHRAELAGARGRSTDELLGLEAGSGQVTQVPAWTSPGGGCATVRRCVRRGLPGGTLAAVGSGEDEEESWLSKMNWC